MATNFRVKIGENFEIGLYSPSFIALPPWHSKTELIAMPISKGYMAISGYIV